MAKEPWQYADYKRQMLAYKVKCRTALGIAADLLQQATEERVKGDYALARSCVLQSRYHRQTGSKY